MMNFTRGPWFATEVHQNWVEICDADKDHDRQILASVQPSGSDSTAYGEFPTRDANARLIASAPELYEIVRRLAMEDARGIPPELATLIQQAAMIIERLAKAVQP